MKSLFFYKLNIIVFLSSKLFIFGINRFIGIKVLRIKRGHKEIGYIAIDDSDSAICTEDGSFIVVGSEYLMNKYMSELKTSKYTLKFIIKKVILCEIIDRIYGGYSFTFDKDSYDRLEPLLAINNIKKFCSNQPTKDNPFITIDSFADARNN